MSVLKPISQVGGGKPPGSGKALLLGLVLGLGGGILIGRYLLAPATGGGETPGAVAPAAGASSATVAAPAPTTAPAGEQTPVAQAPPAPGSPPAAPAAGAGVQETVTPSASGEKPADGTQRLEVELDSSVYRVLSRRLDGRQADVLNAHLGRILVWWLDLRRDVARGDLLQVLYRPAPQADDWRVLAVRYRSSKLSFDRRAFYFRAPGARYGRYYDEQGREVEARLVHSPIAEYEQVTERLNLAGRRHRGIDFKAAEGTPVVAPYRARVMRKNFHTRLNGNCLDLLFIESRRRALLLHLQSIEPGIRPGKIVAAGQVVARSGNTGRSYSPHLHYELRSARGKLLDPFLAEPVTHRRLEGEAWRAFQKTRRLLQRQLEGETTEAAASPPGGNPPAPAAAAGYQFSPSSSK